VKKTIRVLSFFLAIVLTIAIPVMADGAEAKKFEPTANYADLVANAENPEGKPLGTWKAGGNQVYSLVDILPTDKIVKTQGFSGGDYEYYTDSTTNNAYGAAINGPYKKSGQKFVVGNKVSFNKGFGTHPKKNQAEVYINIDVSKYTNTKGEYQCDTFYACVGLTNTASPGVYFQVFADYGDGKLKHIANSSVITQKALGEFNVDITGVKTLRLVVITATMMNDSSACAWLNPSIFKADPSITKPSDKPAQTPDVPQPGGIQKYEATDNFEALVWSDENRFTRPYGPWMAGTNTVYSIMDLIPVEKIQMTQGVSGGDYHYYIDSTTMNEYGATYNGPYKKSSKSFLVGGNVSFNKGFGTHPKANQEQSYIDLDVAVYTDPNGEYKCDTFYACVGLTNTASPGVYFQVFVEYGDGKFQRVANSSEIILSSIGEFNVDIAGVKTLRLVVITSTDNNSSSASAWLNPCIFKADKTAEKPSYKEHDPYDDYATEDPANIPTVELFVPGQTEKEDNGSIGIVVGAAAGVLVVLALVIVLVIKGKKKS